MTTKERFLAKVRKINGGCWEWTASKNWKGYGQFRSLGKNVKAHRYSYELFVEAIPEGLTIDHQCNNKACVKPGHLLPMSSGENTLRGNARSAINKRKKWCDNGHALSGSNLRIVSGKYNPYRQCITCKRASNRAYKSRIALKV